MSTTSTSAAQAVRNFSFQFKSLREHNRCAFSDTHKFTLAEIRERTGRDYEEENLAVLSCTIVGFSYAVDYDHVPILLIDMEKEEIVYGNGANAPGSNDMYFEAALLLARAQTKDHG